MNEDEMEWLEKSLSPPSTSIEDVLHSPLGVPFPPRKRRNGQGQYGRVLCPCGKGKLELSVSTYAFKWNINLKLNPEGVFYRKSYELLKT